MHIMIDLETMGTRPDAPIVAIGAVAFNAHGVHDTLYRLVSLRSSVAGGAVIDPETVMWWLQQDDDARAALVSLDNCSPCIIDAALIDLKAFIEDFGDDGVWGNGASFDNVIVAEAYRRDRQNVPWPFWKDKCYRTVKGMYPDVKMERSGTHHNALDDARSQAEHLIAINEASNGRVL